jgi:hypothetical protein
MARTCTTMIYTDGKVARFAVMRGPMRGRVFDAHKAEIVAVYECGPGQRPDYAKMTAKHATREAPVVGWQAA